MDALFRLSDYELRAIARDLRAGRIAVPFSSFALQEYCASGAALTAAVELQKFSGQGMTPSCIATILEAIAEARKRQSQANDSVEMVWTGPELQGTVNRDTGAVVRELFASAKSEVLIAGFALYQGKKLFVELAEQMDQNPALRVRMFLNVTRGQTETSADSEVVSRFVARFRNEQWPGKKVPEIYYDPRSLEPNAVKRASLHAKTVVIDGETTFISSANFTEAAQERNIELGVLIRSQAFAFKVVWHFESLAANNVLRRAL
jgi:phosphatidylserine/phosphatidylglycerophosphate/cardiolipin synthase-like enzyme